jgi:hypothetical protein
VVALRRLAAAEVDDVADAGEAVARDFDAVFGTGEDGRRLWIGLAGLAVEDKAGARFRAGVLGEEENAGMDALGSGAVAEPGGERDAECEFGRDGAEVEDDGAESSALEEEVSGTEGLV